MSLSGLTMRDWRRVVGGRTGVRIPVLLGKHLDTPGSSKRRETDGWKGYRRCEGDPNGWFSSFAFNWSREAQNHGEVHCTRHSRVHRHCLSSGPLKGRDYSMSATTMSLKGNRMPVFLIAFRAHEWQDATVCIHMIYDNAIKRSIPKLPGSNSLSKFCLEVN